MRRQIISPSKFLFVVFIVSGLCVASLPPLAMAEPPPPTPPHPRPLYEGLEELPYRALTPLQTAPQGNIASAQLAAWSKLVFQSYRDGNWEIYLANGDGSNQTRLAKHSAADIYPRLNRGCTRIAFASKRTGNYEIFTMNLDGSGLTQLTANGTDNGDPSWAPDGTKIAFEAYRDGQAEIYVMNADGSGQTRLTWDGAYDGEPAWSPGGTRIAFTSKRSGGYAIWVMNADGSGQTQLSTQSYSENPVWSPDGTQIAYDSDGNGDGWQELWLMNADGSNRRQVYDPGEYQTDAWARSWSPDGRYVAFTRISFVYYKGNWYWTTAYLDAWDSANPWSTIRLSSQGTDWLPDWQTTDAWAPTSSVNALPAQSPGPFIVRWSGSDAGPSGLKSYDVQVKHGAGGAWTDWQMGTAAASASYPGVGGHTYYFRSRARDNAYNVEPWPPDYDTFTMVEALPPRTAVEPLSTYSRGEITVRWGGSDPGGSGIQTYDVQYRDTGGGGWTDWQMGTTETSASFSGTVGHTYYFRSRGTDNAQNVEGWPSGDGDASTTFYTWAVSGTVRDNRDTPLIEATVNTTPGAVGVIPSDSNGKYVAYVADSGNTYTITWGKSGYGSLPPTDLTVYQDTRFDVVFPPADNVVLNWGFESGNLEAGDWLASGVITPVVTDTLKHTGNYGALLGWQPFAFAQPTNVSNNAGVSSNAQLALDGGGTVHLVWQDSTFGPGEIFYATPSSDGTWSSPQNISNTPDHSRSPQLAVDGGGTVHAVWHDSTPGHYDIFYVGPAPVEQTGDSSIAQAVTIPITMSTPTLSFLYQLAGACATCGSWFSVQVDNGITATTLLSTTTNTDDWTHRWFDLTSWAGQAITLTFTVHQTAGQPNTWAYLDEVSLGSAYPDLWVSKNGPALALPGEQVVYTIAYGNRGGAAASGMHVADTLPAELSFVDASPPPVTTLPLIWEVGDVPAKSDPFTIVVTATVDPAVPLLTTLTNTVSIGVVSMELETFNDTAQVATFIGYRLYLPILAKGYLL